jgi:DNA-3-methyladenine glycosylase
MLKVFQPDLSDAVRAAKELLGYKLVHKTEEGVTAGYIVETESYSQDEPASHAYIGRTMRNSALFEDAGIFYVYFTYGLHFCVNIVTGPPGHGQGVLLRALQPVDGINIMQQRRKVSINTNLTSGPAKLTQAMGITLKNYGQDIFTKKNLYLEPGIKPKQIVTTTRIGIRKAADLPWRFYIKDNPFVSVK